jgi:hypothetical protein
MGRRLQAKLLANNAPRTSLVFRGIIAEHVLLVLRIKLVVLAAVSNVFTVSAMVSVQRVHTYQKAFVKTAHWDMSLWEATKTNVSNAQKERTKVFKARASVHCATPVTIQQLVLTTNVRRVPKANTNTKKVRVAVMIV